MKLGIVGLPNVGKSTLFNAITSTKNAAAANYPFCTIDPNTGVVPVPDARLDKLAEIWDTNKKTPAIVEFVDIAGLVKGASHGEGLGNKFLGNIRECDAIVHVVRCFDGGDIVHVEGSVDPLRDIETIDTELILSDLEMVSNRQARFAKAAKTGDKKALAPANLLSELEQHLSDGKNARSFDWDENDDEQMALRRELGLLTAKPVIYAANMSEDDLMDGMEQNAYYQKVKELAAAEGAQCIPICAKTEEDIAKCKVNIEGILKRKDKLLDLSVGGHISDEEFTQRNSRFNEEIDRLRLRLDELEQERSKNREMLQSIDVLRQAITKELDFTDGFSIGVIDTLLDHIEVHPQEGNKKNEIHVSVYLKAISEEEQFTIRRGRGRTSVCTRQYT